MSLKPRRVMSKRVHEAIKADHADELAAIPYFTYDPEIAAIICHKLASGQTLNAICKGPGMPSDAACRQWALDPKHPFAPLYNQARLVGWHRMADEILDIADDKSQDVIAGMVQTEIVARSRVRIDVRKWMMSKCLPKIYGDRLNLNAESDGNVTVNVRLGNDSDGA